MIVKIKTKYTDGEVELQFSTYPNGTIAILANSNDEYREPIFVATVALEVKPAEGYVFLKGWSENEGVPEALVEAGVVKLTGRTVRTGYCQAIEAKLLVEIPKE